MIVNCVHIHVKKNKIEDFKRATVANHTQTVKEPGNLRFDLIQNASEPEMFMLYEAFESEEAVAFHKTTVHYQVWRDAVADWMASPRQAVKYIIVAPLDKSQW